ncbi:MAG: hypothetical protein RBT05_06935 [Bacteroidales bacterium]|jgi:hypothetical protein|nr:hypothetical protein [Bacteroidales bacterium]
MDKWDIKKYKYRIEDIERSIIENREMFSYLEREKENLEKIVKEYEDEYGEVSLPPKHTV